MRQMLSSDKTKKQSVEEDLIAEGNYVKQKTREIREQLIQAQTEARRQLSSLTALSSAASRKLEVTIAKVRPRPPSSPSSPPPALPVTHLRCVCSLRGGVQGERVLRVAEMYHKLENEQRGATSALFLAEEPEGGGSEAAGPTQVCLLFPGPGNQEGGDQENNLSGCQPSSS